VTLKYKEGFSRYDRELYETLVSFKDKKKLEWECDEIESYINICYTNKMRHKINETISFVKQEEYNKYNYVKLKNLYEGL
jgi:hypothetical protein